MNRLFLCIPSRVFLEVAVLGKLNQRLCVFGRSGFFGESGLELAVDNDVCVATDGGGKVCVQWDVECVMSILFVGDFTRDKVLCALHCLDKEGFEGLRLTQTCEGEYNSDIRILN